jgi:hypothetical protein
MYLFFTLEAIGFLRSLVVKKLLVFSKTLQIVPDFERFHDLESTSVDCLHMKFQ